MLQEANAEVTRVKEEGAVAQAELEAKVAALEAQLGAAGGAAASSSNPTELQTAQNELAAQKVEHQAAVAKLQAEHQAALAKAKAELGAANVGGSAAGGGSQAELEAAQKELATLRAKLADHVESEEALQESLDQANEEKQEVLHACVTMDDEDER